MAKDPKLKFFQVIPTEKKPDIIIDDITKAYFLIFNLDWIWFFHFDPPVDKFFIIKNR